MADLRDPDAAARGYLKTEREGYDKQRDAEAAHRNRLAEIAAQGGIQERVARIQKEGKAGAEAEPAVSPYAEERSIRTVQSVDELLGKVNRWTSGIGSVLSAIPETDARNFAAELETLKANIAFGELTAMREASKTGGALGQVSDREASLLQNTLGALDIGQSPSNLKAQLQKIKDSITRWYTAKAGGPLPSVRRGASGKFEIVAVEP
jgi:hypothetical protein